MSQDHYRKAIGFGWILVASEQQSHAQKLDSRKAIRYGIYNVTGVVALNMKLHTQM
jgi:hypothetical protein